MRAIVAGITFSLVLLFTGSDGLCNEEDPALAEAGLIRIESQSSPKTPADGWLFESALAADALALLED